MASGMTNKNKSTCIDVAKLAGVAHSTVSRVINNAKSVSPATRQKVLNAINMVGYKPSLSARNLVMQRHETIGLITEIESEKRSYSTELIHGISFALTETGNRLAMGLIHYHSGPEALEGLPILKMRSVDGLILDVHQMAGDLEGILSRLDIPYVFVNPPRPRSCYTITPDDVSAAALATQYLIDRGHRHIGYIPGLASAHYPSQHDRMNGYAQTLLKANLTPIPGWDTPLESMKAETLTRRIQSYRKYGCTGLVAYIAQLAAVAFYSCCELGLKIPKDITLSACDFSAEAVVLPIDFACVFLDRALMGRLAVEMLMRRIQNPGQHLRTVVVKGTLQTVKGLCRLDDADPTLLATGGSVPTIDERTA